MTKHVARDILRLFALPQECMINGVALTCYRYTALGSLLRKNIESEWWRSMINSEQNIYPIEQTRLLTDRTEKNDHFCFTSYYPEALEFVNNRLPFGLITTEDCYKPTPNTNKNSYDLYNSPMKRQLRFQYYCVPQDTPRSYDDYQKRRLLWWKKFSSNPSAFNCTEVEQVNSGEQRMSVMFRFPWGQEVIESLSNQGDLPLQHVHEGVNLKGCHTTESKQVLPHVLDIETTLEWACLVYLTDSYDERECPLTSRQRKVLLLHPRLAPYKASIVVSAKTSISHVMELADYLSQQLCKAEIRYLYIQDTQEAELQLLKFDEMGVPFNIVLHEDTLDTGMVGFRSRDTTLQEQVHVTKLVSHLQKYITAE